jgi:hypothetical protein
MIVEAEWRGTSQVVRETLSVLLAVLTAGVVSAVPGEAASPFRYTRTSRTWPGIVVRTFQARGLGGHVRGEVLDVDLRNPHVAVGLLHPPTVAARQPVSRMADAQHAVAGVNGDFFNISENHPGVPPTGAAVGPEIAAGHALKAAVPDGQRFGPLPPVGATTEEVIGVGGDRTGRMTRLRLTGTISVHGPLAALPSPPRAPSPPTSAPTGDADLDDETDAEFDGDMDADRMAAVPPPRAAPRVRDEQLRIALGGLNQYALPIGGVGAFTSRWGAVSRRRAVCGTDAVRRAPCSADTAEVTVRRGVVTRVGGAIGAGTIPAGTTVLVGREAGADVLRRLRPGDRVRVTYRLDGPGHLHFAVGGFAIMREGTVPPGLDNRVLAARTAAGVSRDGRHLYLVVADRRSGLSVGLTLAELAVLLRRAGAADAMNLDGGGSSTFALRVPGESAVSVRNLPSAGAERAVANGIGVFVRP